MKNLKKVLAVALAALMLMMTSIPAFADYYLLELDGEDAYVEVPKNGEEAWVFVPEYDSCYGIWTYIDGKDPDADPVITVYDAYGYEVAYCDDYFDDGENFEAGVEFYGYAGEEYYVYFSDAGGKKATYYAYVYDACADYDGDGYCDVCWYQICDCDCHADGIMGFFWSIKNFFNRLFRINEWCECGYAHW